MSTSGVVELLPVVSRKVKALLGVAVPMVKVEELLARLTAKLPVGSVRPDHTAPPPPGMQLPPDAVRQVKLPVVESPYKRMFPPAGFEGAAMVGKTRVVALLLVSNWVAPSRARVSEAP